MTYFLLIAIFIVNFFTFHLLPELNAAPLRAKDIVKKVKQKYESLESLKADFEQVYNWVLAGETQTLKGTIFLKSGNKYRIETEGQIIVTDGKTVWTYSETNQQVIIDLLSKSGENPLPKDLLFRYSEEYIPHLAAEEKLDGKKTYILNLVPKDKEAFIKSMKIWVDASSWLTVKIEQVDINDNINTYHVRNIEQNIQLDTSLFTLKIPPDTEVVDLR